MLDWKDGQPFSNRFGDVYFSTDSGLEETRHVFLHGNRLAERFAALSAGESFCIGETGFGTGLNFLCAWQLFEQTAPSAANLDFFSVEKFPLSEDELRAALALWPELAAQAAVLLARWRRRVPGWNRWNFSAGRVRLTLAMEDVEQALPELPARCVEAWFLDGFSPAKNPEMWSEAVLADIARASRAGGTLATYTCAGWVRRGLQQAGFEVERVQGFGSKREMVCGRLLPTDAPSALQGAGRRIPSSALIIGGGIAGCAAAHILAQRGIAATLIESAPQLATQGSGNPRGILHARFGAGMNALHRFVLAAYGHALALLDDAVPADGELRSECGLLQLAATEAEAKRITKLSAQEWPAHVLQAVDAATASELVGMKMAHGGLWFPAGGWVVPPQVCARLADHPFIVQRLGCEVTALERTASGWRASGEGFAIEAEQVVVCSGHQAKNLAQFAAFPLQPVRGQISILPATAASESLHAVLCAEGYCAPAVAGQHVAGATSTFDDAATDLREIDHADNLAKIAAHMPALYQAMNQSLPPCRGCGRVAAQPPGTHRRTPSGRKVGMGVESQDANFSTPTPALPLHGGGSVLAGRAGVRCSVPGATPLVGEVEPGLYCSLAHGTRGLLTAGIAGEVIAAAMCGQLPPLPQSLLDALAPLPRVRNKGQCAT
ncbi:MAG: bifunctional tRNA (5-methylaminomethyl-2-thiouridine)(34)-methyltransferase MnmD/FAD-dependent 5-carboxymethylaminomethyl-2-thiouridine(34) oxidoreductase MnmC [Nitrosomonadales bacterium]|nr:bifunctional tRNA (5-methylaminomethyl-2-thiouridine)(34)-methyltransferase MnmD/FAD-dependent 5-carboxymethylaminomethyl-2-thiouridine(34) oxidoreductase MnmC [Nitrosomonadales bacterium]